MSDEVNMIQTLRKFRGGASPSKFGRGQSRDIFRGVPVKKNTLYNIINKNSSNVTFTVTYSTFE